MVAFSWWLGGKKFDPANSNIPPSRQKVQKMTADKETEGGKKHTVELDTPSRTTGCSGTAGPDGAANVSDSGARRWRNSSNTAAGEW